MNLGKIFTALFVLCTFPTLAFAGSVQGPAYPSEETLKQLRKIDPKILKEMEDFLKDNCYIKTPEEEAVSQNEAPKGDIILVAGDENGAKKAIQIPCKSLFFSDESKLFKNNK